MQEILQRTKQPCGFAALANENAEQYTRLVGVDDPEIAEVVASAKIIWEKLGK